MFADKNALRTTRSTSQVCAQWRRLLLNASFLWAKLIDIDDLSRCRTHNWRDEVLQRSGAALLWIMAENPTVTGRGVHSDIVPFFFNLVRSNCHRIQKLVIFGPSWSSFRVTHAMLCFPTPHLDRCEGPFGWGIGGRKKEARLAPLFSNQAPRLRQFNLKNFVADPQAPWLAHLEALELNPAYGIRDALSVLSATHTLQQLKIPDIDSEDIATSFPTVSLPQLQSLEYNGRSSPSATLIAHIDLPVGCSLTIRIDRFDRKIYTEEKPIVLSLLDTFSQYVKRCLQSHIFRSVELEYAREDYISFVCRTALLDKCSLNISIPLRGDSDSHLLEAFLKKLSFPAFESITTFNFVAKSRLTPCFKTFFTHFSSVALISVDVGTLSHLARLQKKYGSSVIFPVLKVIRFTIHNRWYRDTTFVKTLQHFLYRGFEKAILPPWQWHHVRDVRLFSPSFPARYRLTYGGLSDLYTLSTLEATRKYTREKR